MKHLPESSGSIPLEARPAASVIAARSYWPATRAMRASGPPIALFLLSLAVFAPTLLNGFVKWDDDVNLLDNPHYRGLGWSHIRWMFANTLTGHYIPVTWLSFGLDYTIWGMNPIGYHLTNVVLHARQRGPVLPGRDPVAATGDQPRRDAADPRERHGGAVLRRPPVARRVGRLGDRAAGRLSGLFFLLTVLTYLAAVDHGTRRRRHLLAVSVGCYALALLSKSIVMTLPLVLVLLDVYPLGRLSLKRGTWRSGATRGVLIEKLPYLALGIAGGVTAYWAVLSNQYLTLLERYGWTARAAMAGYSGWFYLEETAVPAGLSPLHELPAQVEWLAPRFSTARLPSSG